MKLISCHIENFGQLQNKDYAFNDNLTCIYENNGAGKTTLAAFIKAMFYGLESTKKTDKNFGDRLHYYPFSNGKFGGYLILNAFDKEYRIERYFDKTSSTKDTLKIFNQETHEEETSITDVGEFFFGIDKEAFERTIFINSLSLETKATSSINKKLNNLIDDTNDDNNYEKNIKELEELLKKYTNTRSNKKGELQQEINNLHDAQKQEQSLLLIQGKMDELYTSLDEERKKKTDLEDKIKKQREIDLKLKEWETYETYLKEIEDLKNTQEKIISLYPYGLPSLEEISSIENEITNVTKNEASLKALNFNQNDFEKLNFYQTKYVENLDEKSLNELLSLKEKYKNIENKISSNSIFPDKEKLDNLEKKYANKIPSSVKFEEISNKIKELDKISLEKSNLEQEYPESQISEYSRMFYKDTLPSENEIETLKNNIDKYKQNNDHINSLNEQLAETKGKQNLKLVAIILVVIGILLIAGGITSFILNNLILGIAGNVVGIILSGISIFLLLKKQSTPLENKEKELIKEENLELGKSIKETFNKYIIFEEDYQKALQILISSKDNFQKYLSKKKTIDDAIYLALQKEISSFFSNYSIYSENYYEALEKCKSEINSLYELQEKEKKYIEAKKSFEEEKINLIKDINSILSPLKEHSFNNSLELENIYDNCKEYNSINSRYLEYVRKKEEYSAILNTSQNTIDQFKTKYHIFEDIGSYLKNLSSNSNTLKNDKKNLEEKIEQAKTYKEKNKLLEKPQKSEISIEKLDLEKDAILLNIKNLEKAITENENELLTLPDIKNTIQDTHNKIQNIKHRIEIIEKTIFFFTTAENNLKNRFITPIYSSYTTYIQDFDSILKKGTSMDFNLNISFDIQGELKSYQHLSQGLLSILEVSLRFALIDNMYKKEKPSIILDDPFVYLDKDNLQIAKKVLQNLAKQNQIIYFCCHESRKI